MISRSSRVDRCQIIVTWMDHAKGVTGFIFWRAEASTGAQNSFRNDLSSRICRFQESVTKLHASFCSFIRRLALLTISVFPHLALLTVRVSRFQLLAVVVTLILCTFDQIFSYLFFGFQKLSGDSFSSILPSSRRVLCIVCFSLRRI